MVTASLKNYRIAPRKMRLAADMIRGKSVAQASYILANAEKKGRHPLVALLNSAVANASNNFKLDKDTLVIKEIRVDQGLVMKRYKPRSRGMANPIKRKTSHVTLTLAPLESKKKKAGAQQGVPAEARRKKAATK